MTTEMRSFPRIRFDGPGLVQVPLHYADPGAGTREVPVSISTLSCKGAGVVLDTGDTLVPGTVIDLSFTVDGYPLSFPARVVWAAGKRAGLRLRFGDSRTEDKHHYAHWIVPKLNRELAKERA